MSGKDPEEHPRAEEGAEVGAADAADPEDADGAEGSGAGGPQDSFIERLQRHFGTDADPEISLHRDDEAAASEGSSTSRGLIRRLADQISVGPRYRVRQQIARGGMGTILRIWDDDLRRNLAMKVMHGKGRLDDESGLAEADQEKLGRFLEEAQITGQLDHPGIVPVHDLGVDDRGRLYFTMRLVRGRELKHVLDHARVGEEGWTRTRVLGLVLKVCEAMAFAHSKGVVHRDLKPSNVMVGRFGEVYVMDWGLARVLGRQDSHDLRLRKTEEQSSLSLVRTVRKDESELNPDSPLVTMDGDVVGTPSYMAIEQARGKLDEVGPRSDVYSLGAILYYMLTGRAPYVAPGERISPHTVLNRVLQGPPEPVSKLAPDEPAELLAICEKAMARDASERYSGMLEVADDIQAYLENRVVRAYEGGSLAEFRKWVGRNRGMAAGVAGMVVLSIASAFGFAWQQQLRVELLEDQQEQTRQAKEAAEHSATLAEQSRVLADKRAAEARDNAERAAANERQASRESYAAHILAADYSLKLEDVVEARASLQRCVESHDELRGWEWGHLRLKANGSIGSLGQIWTGGADEVAVKSDGRTILTLARNGRLRFHDKDTGAPVEPGVIALTIDTATGVQPLPLCMDLTADGSRVVLAGNDQRVRVFDARAGGAALLDLPLDGVVGHESRVSAAAFSRDGRTLATGADNGSVLVWDARTGELVTRFFEHKQRVTDVAWSPDSRRFATASADGTLRIWDLPLRHGYALQGHQGAVRGVVWDASGERVFSVGVDGTLNQWSEAGRLSASWAGHRGPIRSIDYDPALDRLVTASDDGTIRVWNAETGEATVLLGHEGPVMAAAFGPDGRFIVSCGSDGSVDFWDPRGDLAVTELLHHARPVQSIAFSPDGGWVLTASADQDLVLWDALAGEPLRRLRGHTDVVYQGVFGPQGKWVYSASDDGTARRWDVETGQVRTIYRSTGPVTAVAVSPDGTRVYTGGQDGEVRVLDAETASELRRYSGQRGRINDLALSPDGLRLASGAHDVRVLDLRDDASLLSLPGRALSLAFGPDGSRLITATKPLSIWNAETGEHLTQVDEDDRPRAVAYAPDGRRFASGLADGKVRIREAESGRILLVLDWPDEKITALAFSPDGARLAAGSESGAARIWETGGVAERRGRWLELQALRQEAEPLVARLFNEHFFLQDVMLQLQGDAGLEPELRETAIRLANLRGDDAHALLEACLDEALPPGRTEAVYGRALRRAQAAHSMLRQEDEDRRVLLALGVAQARAALHREAIVTLEEVGALDSALGARDETVRLLFLAMARFQAGEVERAVESFQQAYGQIRAAPELGQDDAIATVYLEVEALIGAESGS